ncbi:hypothetical protein ACGFIX_14415 [Nocardia salmonicida]|uniref:hypothetical protein n=1 Tax=Nocardia salmonicida TaxID=53431 RepID=UPI00371FD0C5
MTAPHGLTIVPLDSATIAGFLTATTEVCAPPTHFGGVDYAFAAYPHGYDVARRVDDQWLWGSTEFASRTRPGYPRAGTSANVERVRFFGPASEVLLTRIGDDWHGWHYRPVDVSAGTPLSPRRRAYLVTTGDDFEHHGAFTRIEHRSGQFSVVPYTFGRGPGYAYTTEYFTSDPDTGAVRVAAVTWCGYGTDPASFTAPA